ncbi:MAG: HAD-IIB family hydrolase [Methanosarcinales archaeon]
MMKYLLVCDLDDTLTGDKDGIEVFNELVLSEKKKFYLVYSSGRFKNSMMSLLERERLIQPDSIISNVGTEIYYAPNRNICKEWEEIIGKNWAKTKERVFSVLDNFDLQLQPYEKRFVISYYVENGAIVEEIRKILQGLEVKIVWTKNQCLDIIPKNAGKGNAAKFISNKLSLPIIGCGDSENDVDMLEKSKYGILVGNASNNLKKKLSKHSNIFIAKSSYAKGVIEGLKFYGIIN